MTILDVRDEGGLSYNKNLTEILVQKADAAGRNLARHLR
jgi:hypothetical protein